MNRWHRIALGCALVPLFAGTAIFVTWLLCHQYWLMIAGYLTIFAGLLLCACGLAAVFMATRKARRQGAPCKKKNLLVLGMLLANFPVAIAMSSYAYYVFTQYEVLIINDSPKPIDHVVITDPTGKHYSIHDIAPHSHTRHAFHFAGEGNVDYRIESATFNRSGLLIGYTTDGLGGKVRLRIDSTGAIAVDESIQ